MLIDVRTYRVKPGKLLQELDLYARYGLVPQTRHLGPPIVYLQSESGALNTLVHLWAFEKAGDRENKRTAMMSDPDWLNYLKMADEAGFLVEQATA